MCKDHRNCGYKELARQLQRKTAECEELKDQLQANQPTGICETCMATAILQNDKYRKALEEIKEIVKDWYKNEWSCYMCRKNMDKKLEDILDIINKAKRR